MGSRVAAFAAEPIMTCVIQFLHRFNVVVAMFNMLTVAHCGACKLFRRTLDVVVRSRRRRGLERFTIGSVLQGQFFTRRLWHTRARMGFQRCHKVRSLLTEQSSSRWSLLIAFWIFACGTHWCVLGRLNVGRWRRLFSRCAGCIISSHISV